MACVAHRLGAGPCEISVIHMPFTSSHVMVPMLFRWPYLGDPTRAASLSYPKDINLAADFLVFWPSESLLPLFLDISQALCTEAVV